MGAAVVVCIAVVFSGPTAVAQTTSPSAVTARGVDSSPWGRAGREVVERRTLNSRTLVSDNGEYRTQISLVPLHFENQTGELQRVDNKLVPAGADVVNRAASYTVRLPPSLDQDVDVETERARVGFALLGAKGERSSDGSTAQYTNALPGVDVRYVAQPDAVKEELVLTDDAAPTKFTFDVRLPSGAKLVAQKDGSVLVEDKERRHVGVFEKPFMYDDAYAKRRERAGYSEDVKLFVTEGGRRLQLEADAKWVRDPRREGAVIIDPTLTFAEARRDCSIKSTYSADTNYCSSDHLDIGTTADASGGPLRTRRSLLFFDDRVLPRNAEVKSARLSLHARKAPTVPLDVAAHQVTASWTALATWNQRNFGLNWATAGGDFDAGRREALAQGVSATGWHSWQLDGVVQRWLNGTPNYGVLLKQDVESGVGDDMEADSSESPTASLRPMLEVRYEPGVSTRSTVSTTPQQDCAIKNGTTANTTECASDHIDVGSSRNADGSLRQRRSILKFDLADVPARAKITSAQLVLRQKDQRTSTPVAVDAHRVTQPWTNSATWNSATAGVPWGTVGGVFDPRIEGSDSFGGLDSDGAHFIDLTRLVQAWTSGAPNEGILLKQHDEATVENDFNLDSSEAAVESFRPSLLVTYEMRPADKVYFWGTDYDVDGQDKYGLWRVDPNGHGRPELVTDAEVSDEHPELSPDGQTFVSNSGSVLPVDPASDQASRIWAPIPGINTNSDRGFAWHPDNERVVFSRPECSERAADGSCAGYQRRLWIARRDGAESTPLAASDSVGRDEASFSPDGRRIVYVAGDMDCCDQEIHVANADLSESHKLADASGFPSSIEPHVSPDGTNVVYISDSGRELWTVPLQGGVPRLTLRDSALDKARWSTDGRRIVFHRYGSLYTIRPDGTDKRLLMQTENRSVDGYAGGITRQPTVFNADRAGERLQQYVPRLRYDADERNRLISAASITDNREVHGAVLPYDNRLCFNRPDPCNDFVRGSALGLSYLGAQYADGSDSSSDHYLDESGSEGEKITDANRLLGAGYGNRLYGRVVQREGKTYLQYWLFYYYNGAVDYSLGIGPHEGDWEFVQVQLDEDGIPLSVAFGHHKKNAACNWDARVRKERASDNQVVPSVFVAANSHASYPEPGKYDLALTAVDNARGDQANPDEPELETVFSGPPATPLSPSWLAWPGRWGSDVSATGADQPSPRGPAQQPERWETPEQLHGDQACIEPKP